MKKRQIILELTPLLDVILILLFAVLIQSRMKVAASSDLVRDTNAEKAGIEQELNETKKELAKVKNRTISLGAIEENSLLITMTVEAASVHRVALDVEGESIYVNLTDDNDVSDKILESLRLAIQSGGKESVFLIFQYDRNRIYHQEYEKISQAVEELKPLLAEDSVILNYIEVDVTEGTTEEE